MPNRSPRAERLRSWGVAILEVFLIFAVFVAYGAWPTPDVNEQYYVGKAIHFWNHDWLSADPFLNTPDSHWLFYGVFGLLSFFFTQNVAVWVGRVLVWLLMAIAWRRLSRSLIPVKLISVVTATAFAFYLDTFHLAGEWIIGGVEGKSFAFPLVFWGLAYFVEGKFNRAWVLYGLASAFHVLVGGWVVIASLFAWGVEHILRRLFALKLCRVNTVADRIRLCACDFLRILPGLAIGGVTSLLGVIPALRLDSGVTASILRESRQIYVFKRLSHHLVASSLPWTFLTRFGLLVLGFVLVAVLTAILIRRARREELPLAPFESDDTFLTSDRFARVNSFVVGALVVASIGLALDYGAKYLASSGRISDYRDVAGLLRYYWYRLSDWVVPFGFVMTSARLITSLVYVAFNAYHSSDERQRLFKHIPVLFSVQLFLGVGFYWFFHFILYRHSMALANANIVDGSIPIPKPTEAVAFIAALDAFGLSILCACAIGTLCRKLSLKRDRVVMEFNARVGLEGRFTISNALLVGIGLWLLFAVLAAPGQRLLYYVDLRSSKVVPRSEPPKESIAGAWRETCRWVAANTPKDAVFLVPRGCDSFKWLAGRAEAGSWKEIPQDAKSIVEWNRKMELFYANPGAKEDSPMRWNQALNVVFINKGRAQILEESASAGYDYAILEAAPYTVFAVPEAARRWKEFIDSDAVYQNQQFVVLQLNKKNRY